MKFSRYAIGGAVVAALVLGIVTIDVGPPEVRAAKKERARASWFISPDGIDTEVNGQGTHPTIPWRTLDYALNTPTVPVPGDTFFCMTGVWEAPDAPSDTRMRSTLQGDFEFPTVISSYRGGTPIFDGSGYEGDNLGALFFQNQGGVRLSHLNFFNYFDEDTTNNYSTAILQQSNETVAVDTLQGMDVIGCKFWCDDSGDLGTLGRVRMAIRYFTNSSTPGVDVLDRPFIENNRIERCGDHAIGLGYTPYAAVQGNYIASELRFNVDQPDGPDGIVVDRVTEGHGIARNQITEFDHGISGRGFSGIYRENTLFNLNDDCIFIADDTSREMVIEQNVCRYSGDDGYDLRGSGICRRNTAWHWNDNGIAFTSPGTNGWEVYDNILVDACVCNPDEPVQTPNYVNIQNDVGPDLFFNWNTYFDPQGATFEDGRAGGGVNMTLAEWQAKGHDADSFERYPAFGDTVNTELPNLHVWRSGGAVGTSRFGGTMGARLCIDCYWWVLTTVGEVDSVEVLTLDEQRGVSHDMFTGGVFKFGNTYVYDEPLTLDPLRRVQLTAHWTINTAPQDSPQTATQTLIPPTSDDTVRNKWYISPDGDDAASGMTANAPWKSWAFALGNQSALSPGDTLVADGGTWSGTDCPCADEVTKGGPDTELPTVVVGNGSVLDAFSYVDNDCANGAFFTVQSPNWIWRNLEMRDAPFPTSNGPRHAWFVEDVDIERFELRQIDVTHVQRDSTGGLFKMNFDAVSEGLAIVECNIGHTGSSAIEILGTVSSPRISNCVFSRYVIGGPNHTALKASQPGSKLSDLRLENCTFVNVGTGAVLGGVRAKIRENQFINANKRGLTVQGDFAEIRGNLFRECTTYALNLAAGTGMIAEHNTFYRNGDRTAPVGTGVSAMINISGSLVDYTIRGNWFYRMKYHGRNGTFPPGGQMIVLSNGSSADVKQFDYNYYWDNGLGPGTAQPAAWVIDFSIKDFPTWQAGGFDQNSTFTSFEPSFVDSLTDNWTPIDAGVRDAHDGATVGAWPGQDSQLWDIVILKERPDSLNLRIIDPEKVVRQYTFDSGIFRRQNIFLVETEQLIDSGLFGQWWGEWKIWNPSVFQNISRREVVTGGTAVVDTHLIAEAVWKPTSAAYRWRTIHSADSTGWADGSGAFLGTIITRDASTLGRVPYASVRIFGDAARTQQIGNLTTAANGERGYAYEPDQTYYLTGWATGYQTSEADYTPTVDGFEFFVDLESIDAPITTDPALCTVLIATIDFQNVPTDSILVEATFEGQGANTGDLILSYSSVSCVTDAGGFCGVDLVRSVEIDTPDRIDTYTFTMTDLRRPVVFAPITFRQITVPDQASANLADLVP